MTLEEEKKRLRSELRARRAELSAEECAALSAAACARILQTVAYQNAGLLLAYMAMPHECDPHTLVADAWARGKRVAFPRCAADNTLGLYVPNDAAALAPGKYGILEPVPERAAAVALAEIDLIVLPGVAFDPNGGRLGQGGGYYDRLLASARAATIGIAFPLQIVAQIPAEPFDRPVDAVATADTFYVRRP